MAKRKHVNTDRKTVKERVDHIVDMLKHCGVAPCRICRGEIQREMQAAVRQALARNDRRTKAGR